MKVLTHYELITLDGKKIDKGSIVDMTDKEFSTYKNYVSLIEEKTTKTKTLKEQAKELGIKGSHLMNDDTLAKKIKELNNAN